jgi:rubrerythrin
VTIKSRISKDIRDEKAAKKGYDNLAKTVRKTMGRAAADTIKHIAKEEKQHKSMLLKLKRKTGKKK